MKKPNDKNTENMVCEPSAYTYAPNYDYAQERRSAKPCAPTAHDLQLAHENNMQKLIAMRTKLLGRNIEHLCINTKNFKFNRDEANQR